MKIHILSWNVREINEGEKQKVIKSLIWFQMLDLICLHETKVQQMLMQILRHLGVGKFLEWGVVNAKGQAKRILVFWDNGVVELIDMEFEEHSISFHFENYEDSFFQIFLRVYGSVLNEEREDGRK